MLVMTLLPCEEDNRTVNVSESRRLKCLHVRESATEFFTFQRVGDWIFYLSECRRLNCLPVRVSATKLFTCQSVGDWIVYLSESRRLNCLHVRESATEMFTCQSVGDGEGPLPSVGVPHYCVVHVLPEDKLQNGDAYLKFNSYNELQKSSVTIWFL